MSKILACDLDGTLFYPKGRKQLISDKNIVFLRKFIDSGNRVVFVSSRGRETIEKAIKEVDRSIDYISVNGCVICVDGNIVRDTSIPNNTLEYIVNNIVKDHKPLALLSSSYNYPITIAIYAAAGRLLKWFYKTYYDLAFGIYAEKYIVDNDVFDKEMKDGKVYTIRVFTGLSRKKTNKINKELNKILREQYPNLEASWVGPLIELTPQGCSKAASLIDYLNMINASRDDVYVIGDSGNDISMFNEFHDHSFVMKHAYPSVKKYASNEVSRVYKLDKYLLEKEKK